jgi:hypothetical protein
MQTMKLKNVHMMGWRIWHFIKHYKSYSLKYILPFFFLWSVCINIQFVFFIQYCALYCLKYVHAIKKYWKVDSKIYYSNCVVPVICIISLYSTSIQTHFRSTRTYSLQTWWSIVKAFQCLLLSFNGFIICAECDGRLYGENCSIPCGMCLNMSQCQHINGSCLDGCDSGFQGDNCTQGKWRLFKQRKHCHNFEVYEKY